MQWGLDTSLRISLVVYSGEEFLQCLASSLAEELQCCIAAFKKRGSILPKKLFFALMILLLAVSGVSQAQKLQNLVNQPPDGAGIGFLLTDGTLMFQGNQQSDWWRFTPDNKGSYIKGSWKQAASLPSGYVPLYFASAVLADGRLVIGNDSGNLYCFGAKTSK